MLYQRFWNHSKQHSSKTIPSTSMSPCKFWNHSKQHSSKTALPSNALPYLFWNHSKQHSSKTSQKIFLTKFRNRAIRPSQTSARQVPIVTLIIPYFQGSRNSLDPAHTAENHRLFEVRQIKPLVD